MRWRPWRKPAVSLTTGRIADAAPPPEPSVVMTPTLSLPDLVPGTCECGHGRCHHYAGRGHCGVGYPVREGWPHGSVCACQRFILDKRDDGDDEKAEPPVDPEVEELEKIYGGRQ